jgi:serine/threonine protein kinase
MPKIELGMILKERYKITEQLGSGGMGEVFLADDLTLETPVAVKINHNLNETSSSQFIREARLLAGLKHPNLPRVIDYFTDNDCQYLVMDYIPGDDLKTIVERHDKLNPDMIVKWAVQLGSALTYLHNHKPPIFHRDIKPANIKLTPGGEVVLVDFGIAKTGEASQETQTGAWAFSPGFAPPEQVSGMRTGPYSDQYGLAATIYYLFVGKAPADSAQRMMGSINYVPLNDANPAVAGYVSDAIGKALSVRPEDRFGSVPEFLTALTNPDVTVRADGEKTVFAPRGSSAGPLPPVPGMPTPQPHKSSGLAIILGIAGVLVLVVGGFFVLRMLGIIGGLPSVIATPVPTLILNTEVPTQKGATSTPEIASTEAATTAPTTAPTETTAPMAAALAQSIGHGGKVAYISNRQGDGYDQIWLMDVGQDASGNPVAINFTQLTNSPSDKSHPSWSPDGTKLLFTASSSEFSQNGDPFAKDIWVLDINHPDLLAVDLSRKVGNDDEATWSPTGKLIAFTSYYRTDGVPQLFIMNPDGSNQTLLTNDPAETSTVADSEHSPTWYPNDTYLFYVLDYQGSSILYYRDNFTKYIHKKNFDRSSPIGKLGMVSNPQISADGLMIVYTRAIGTKTNIYSTPYAKKVTAITPLTDTNMDSTPCWSPDGKWILFTSTRDNNSEIYIMKSDGSGQVDLTNFPAEDKEPAWQPVALQ